MPVAGPPEGWDDRKVRDHKGRDTVTSWYTDYRETSLLTPWDPETQLE